MRHAGWLTKIALGLCLMAGCDASEDGRSETETDEVGASESELRRPGHPRKPKPSKDAGPATENPCNLLDCRDGQRCELQPVQCIRAPCPEVPVCVPITSGCDAARCAAGTHCVESADGVSCVPDVEAPARRSCAVMFCAPNTRCVEAPTGARCIPTRDDGLSCANVRCTADTHCVDDAEGPRCVPNEVTPCAATLCAAPSRCEDTPTGAKCIPLDACDATRCDRGTHCELIDVVCVRAPCPPQPTCVPDVVDPCATVRCGAGTHCEVEQVQCVRAPCPPVASCVAD